MTNQNLFSFLVILSACNCVSSNKIETNITSTGYLSGSSSTTDPGVFSTTVENTNTSTSELSSSSTSDTSESGSFGPDLGNESSSTTGESIPLCNSSETGVCNVFVSSEKTAPNIWTTGFDEFCTAIKCGSNEVCKPYRALIRTENGFWEHFSGFNGSYVLTSGKVIATGTDSLEYASSINEDESGNVLPNKTLVWTGFTGLFWTCYTGTTPWRTNDPIQFGDAGYIGGEANTWYSAEKIPCQNYARVICVETPQQ